MVNRFFSNRTFGAIRSSQWPKIRKEHLKDNPNCAVCGGTKKCEVHHKKPVHLFPNLELDNNNLITLCESKKDGINCHLFVGHLGSYSSYNLNATEDAKNIHDKIVNRP